MGYTFLCSNQITHPKKSVRLKLHSDLMRRPSDLKHFSDFLSSWSVPSLGPNCFLTQLAYPFENKRVFLLQERWQVGQEETSLQEHKFLLHRTSLLPHQSYYHFFFIHELLELLEYFSGV